MHRKIFFRVGADQVVFPENESGIRLAKNLLSAGFVDMIELAENVSMVELDVKAEWVGKNLLELNLRKKYGINVVAIKRGKEVSTLIDPEQPISADMELIVIANTSKLGKLS
jgi:trk system potassium uptake protein TrkA